MEERKSIRCFIKIWLPSCCQCCILCCVVILKLPNATKYEHLQRHYNLYELRQTWYISCTNGSGQTYWLFDGNVFSLRCSHHFNDILAITLFLSNYSVFFVFEAIFCTTILHLFFILMYLSYVSSRSRSGQPQYQMILHCFIFALFCFLTVFFVFHPLFLCKFTFTSFRQSQHGHGFLVTAKAQRDQMNVIHHPPFCLSLLVIY